MKNYTIYYKKETGLNQTTPLEAFCYRLNDGFYCFYADEAKLSLNHYFKAVNKDAIWVINEEVK